MAVPVRLAGGEHVGVAASMQAPPALMRPAPAGFRWTLFAWLAVGMAVAVAAVGVDVRGQLQAVPPDSMAPPRLLAALAVLIAGTVAGIATLERRRRDLPRRHAGLLLMAVALVLLYVGQGPGYVITAAWPGAYEQWIGDLPDTAGIPLLAVALVLLAWPPRMGGMNVLGVVGDGAVAALTLATVWFLVLLPATRSPDSDLETFFAHVDVWMLFLLLVAVVVIASTSRRTGALPIRQLILLQCSVLVFLAAQIASDVVLVPAAGAVDWTLPGLVAAVGLFLVFAQSPALAAELPAAVRQRDFWSTTLPFLPVVLAVLAYVAARLSGAIPLGIVSLMAGALLVIGVINLVLRMVLVDELRGARLRKMSVDLADGGQGAWFNALLGDSTDLITVVDRDGTIVYQTPSVLAVLGYEQGDHVGRPFADLLLDQARSDVAALLLRSSHDDADRGPHDLVLLDSRGWQHHTETLVTPLVADGGDGFVLTTRDVTDRRRLRAELAASGKRDGLTGLTNRDGFVERLREELAGSPPDSLAVALLDVEGFRDLNDGRGHDAGDDVLRAVAAALDRLPHSVPVVGRIGGDEFGLVVMKTAVEPEIGAVDRELRKSLRSVLLNDGSEVGVDYALGYAVHEGRQETASDLMERADLAMAAARTSHLRTVVRYQPTMRATLVSRLRTEADLRDALDGDRLVVHYQPVVRLSDGRLESVEALARLVGKAGELVPPSDFIPRAEDLGLIHRIGSRVLNIALQDSHRIADRLGREVPVAVNVSSHQFDGMLAGTVADVLAATGTPAERLIIELTESVLAENQEAASRQMADLQAMGCAVALDDFGTGYSSLSYLVGLPVDLMKIDGLFVGNLGSSRKSFAVVRTLLQLAQTLGLATIAEGVETIEQADILRGMNCDRAQGFLYAPALSLPDLLLLSQISEGVLPVVHA